jgi:hypothetical protein
MAQRRYGPTQGAGVAVIELEAEKILEAAPLGVTAYVGALEKGPTDKLIQTFSKKQFLKKCGGRIGTDGQTPDAAIDFWDHSNGAGELHLVRVTDGTEVKSSLTMFDRSTTKMNKVAKFEAANGGRWGGKGKAIIGAAANSGAITETTLTTGKTMLLDEWKGGTIKFDGLSRTYDILSNTTAGIITVKADSTMSTDWTAGAGSDLGYKLELARNVLKEVSLVVEPGEIDTDALFGLSVYVNGGFVKKWANLSMDPDSAYYFVRLINDDLSNDEITATDLNSPSSVDLNKRPANVSGISTAVAALLLTAKVHQFYVTLSPTVANPTIVVGTTTDTMKFRDRLEIEMTSSSAFTVKSLDLGASATVGTGSLTSLCTPTSPYLPPFTITNGGTILATGDKMILEWNPMEPDALIGGYLYPDYTNEPLKKFRVSDNDHKTISIAVGDLTAVASVSDKFTVSYPQQMAGGYDGVAGLADSHFITKFDTATSKINQLTSENKGLVKLACPGKTSTNIQKAGAAYAEAKNYQFRYEIPDTVITEDLAVAQINSTLGRNDFAVVSFPSYGYVDNPERPGQLKLTTLTGMIHGREALVAKNYDGYHKAAAGTDVTLPSVVRLPATELNEEVLNPQGVGVVKKLKGNFVVWGDRTVASDPAWKWKHQRELMSHYENRLREGFDWIVFALNNRDTQAILRTTLEAFFLPEFTKGAIRGATFANAISIKLDDEINTNATMANGDLFAELKLRLADTVERFIIRVGKAGIFEQLG